MQYHEPTGSCTCRYCLRCDPDKDILIRASLNGRGEYRITNWFVNRNTPVGDDADYYERMPHGGSRYIDWNKLIAIERKVI